MDFSKLMAAASKNDKKVRKTVESIDPEHSKLKFGYHTSTTATNSNNKKLDKQKCAKPIPSTKSQISGVKSKDKINKQEGPSKAAIAAVLARKKEEEEKKRKTAKDEREKRIRDAIKSAGGKLTKQIAKQFKLDAGEVVRYSITHTKPPERKPVLSPEGELMQAAFVKRLNAAKNQKQVCVTKQRLCTDKPEKRKDDSKASISAPSEKKKKPPPPPPLDFAALMKMAAVQKPEPLERIGCHGIEKGDDTPKPKEYVPVSVKRTREPSPRPTLPPKTLKKRYPQDEERLRKERVKSNGYSNKMPPKIQSSTYAQPKILPNHKTFSTSPPKSLPSKESNICGKKVASSSSQRPVDVRAQGPSKQGPSKQGPGPGPGPRSTKPGPSPDKTRPPQNGAKGIASNGYRSVLQAVMDRKRPAPMAPAHYDTESDYDSEMDDFIDDSEPADVNFGELHETLRSVYKYDKRKFVDEDHDDRDMESSYRQICSEEAKSLRMAKFEDEMELKREQGLIPKNRRF